MKTGTKSLLFGVHNVIWHPITVIIAWKALYGKLPNFKELVCIIIHDWGYWGCENMDDEKGQEHPIWAANAIYRLFEDYELFKLCFLHSRHLAMRNKCEPSKLCWADKLSIAYDPRWFYLLRARLSRELREYRKESADCGFCPIDVPDKEWFDKFVPFAKEQAFNQKSSTLYMNTVKE